VINTLSSRARYARVAVLLLLVAGVALELGALATLHGARSWADSLSSRGDFIGAIAVDRLVRARSGPLYLLAARVGATGNQVGQTQLDWASAQAARGDVEVALAVLDGAEPAVQPQARRLRARIALDGARAADSRGAYAVALRRLDLLAQGDPPADLASQAAALRPIYVLDAARALLGQGRAADAVAAIDGEISRAGAVAGSPLPGLLPAALLAAGRAALAANDEQTARLYLPRLADSFPASPESQPARSLLAAPQPVAGTLVHRDGTPLTRIAVRLGSHFRQVGSGYLSSQPFYPGSTDGSGDFTLGAVPLGGPYVLEVLEPQGWTTIVDGSGHPAYQVTVDALTPVDLTFVVVPG
jgi:hypothetical protein